MSGAIPNERPIELDLAVDEAMERLHARESLIIDICELRIRMYVPLFIRVDHYWLRKKPQAEAQHACPDSYCDRKPGRGSQGECTVPSHLDFPSIKMYSATARRYGSLRALQSHKPCFWAIDMRSWTRGGPVLEHP
jgi:hypothetical protein